MSAGRCPKCHSDNTRTAYENYIFKGLGIAAGVAAAIFMPNNMIGKIGPSNVIKEEIKKNICNDCGHEW